MKYKLPEPSARAAHMHHLNVSRSSICAVEETLAHMTPRATSDASGQIRIRIAGWDNDAALEALEGALAQMLADVVAFRAELSPKGSV